MVLLASKQTYIGKRKYTYYQYNQHWYCGMSYVMTDKQRVKEDEFLLKVKWLVLITLQDLRCHTSDLAFTWWRLPKGKLGMTDAALLSGICWWSFGFLSLSSLLFFYLVSFASLCDGLCVCWSQAPSVDCGLHKKFTAFLLSGNVLCTRSMEWSAIFAGKLCSAAK